jgi:hypothetical protein
MGQDTNIVLEGRFKGQNLNFDNTEGLVWIGRKSPENFNNFFYKDIAISIKKLDEKESSLRDSVHMWLGSVAAAGMSSVQDYIISVEWKTGEESLIKVRDAVYEIILRNMTKNQPFIDYEPRYIQAIKDYECNDYVRVENALKIFSSISFYKESEVYAKKCQSKLNSSELSSQREIISKEKVQRERNSRKGMFIATICATIFCLILAFVPDMPIIICVLGVICCSFLSLIFGRGAFENSKTKRKNTPLNVKPEDDENGVFVCQQLPYNEVAIKIKSQMVANLQGTLIPETISSQKVTTIAENCFAGCENIENIIIPLNITRIEKNAFSGCILLTEIYYKGTKSNWYSVSKDILWDANMPTYTIYCTDGTITK